MRFIPPSWFSGDIPGPGATVNARRGWTEPLVAKLFQEQ